MDLPTIFQLTHEQIDALEDSELLHVHFQLDEYVRTNEEYAELNKRLFVSLFFFLFTSFVLQTLLH